MTYKVAVLMGSPNDAEKMAPAAETLNRYGIEANIFVMSAHRSPDQVSKFAKSARDEGYVAFICGAGMAAHLAGAVAAHSTLPVIGVPLSGGAINGWDSLLATVQMPKGVPVATVAIGSAGATNSAYLAAQILGIESEEVRNALVKVREEGVETIKKSNQKLAGS